ncbi:FAD-binding domain-containing protein [Hesseltinella vesiculosa]|uniref:FAD-binding domain-containing protein n=1 Tax=Hesseltinella vesiculosa TaxID=101127 RepID=A0A1X2GT26_9FUNG|nr:FAD-binding domain-containing protein [Hesseltinella vesiculosa]
MCQFCGIDPAFAAYFEKDDQPHQDAAAPTSSDAPNYFRMKPNHPRYSKLTTPQLTTFAGKLSANAKVIAPHQQPEFEQASKRWSKFAAKKALAIIQVATPEDVSKTVILATSHAIPFVVKGGGHSPKGASSSQGGLVIDLSRMRAVHVKAEECLVIAEGGCLASDVLKATSPYGLACVTGTTSHVGMGGLTLGGGYGYLTGLHGLALDNLMGAQVVTADGQILTVNDKEHADLFWGLRGAGNRLAVVTKLIIQAHAIPRQVWTGTLVFGADQLDVVIDALNAWYDQHDAKASAALSMGDGDDLTISLFYNDDDGSVAEANFAPLLSLNGKSSTTQTMPFWKVNTLGDQPFLDVSLAFDSANVAPPLKAAHLKHIHDTMTQVPRSWPGCKTGMYLLMVQPDGVLRKNNTAFPWRDDHFDVGLNVVWTETGPAPAPLIDWLHDTLQPAANAQGQADRLYSNHSDFCGPAAHEFGDHLQRLQQLKAKWDPHGVFCPLPL